MAVLAIWLLVEVLMIGAFAITYITAVLGLGITGQSKVRSVCRYYAQEVHTPHPSMATILAERDGQNVVIGIRAENMETLAEPTEDALRVSVQVVELLGS